TFSGSTTWSMAYPCCTTIRVNRRGDWGRPSLVIRIYPARIASSPTTSLSCATDRIWSTRSASMPARKSGLHRKYSRKKVARSPVKSSKETELMRTSLPRESGRLAHRSARDHDHDLELRGRSGHQDDQADSCQR